MRLTNNRIGYYEPTLVVNSKSDLTNKELSKIKEKQDIMQAVAFLVTFMALTAFAIWASYVTALAH